MDKWSILLHACAQDSTMKSLSTGLGLILCGYPHWTSHENFYVAFESTLVKRGL